MTVLVGIDSFEVNYERMKKGYALTAMYVGEVIKYCIHSNLLYCITTGSQFDRLVGRLKRFLYSPFPEGSQQCYNTS